MLSTLRYFEIIDNEGNFTETGNYLRKVEKRRLNSSLKNTILKKEIFWDVYAIDVQDTSEKADTLEIVQIIKKYRPKMKDNIAIKRARYIRAIVDWCLAN